MTQGESGVQHSFKPVREERAGLLRSPDVVGAHASMQLVDGKQDRNGFTPERRKIAVSHWRPAGKEIPMGVTALPADLLSATRQVL